MPMNPRLRLSCMMIAAFACLVPKAFAPADDAG